MPNSTDKPKYTPHHRLTVPDVIRDYRDGLLTAKGAVFYLTAASRRMGDVVKFSPRKVSDKLGIVPRTFHRCVAELRLQRRIDFEAEGNLLLKVPIKEGAGVPEYYFFEETGQICHSEGHLDHTKGHFDHTEGQICHSKGHLDHTEGQICPEKSLKQASGADSRKPLSLLSTQSLSLITEGERETDLEIEPDFRKWLENKAKALPQPPALLEQWIVQQAKKKANQREFEKSRIPKVIASPETLPLEKIEDLSQEEYWKRVHAGGSYGKN